MRGFATDSSPPSPPSPPQSCSYKPDVPSAYITHAQLQWLRLLVGSYMLLFTVFFLRACGLWPLISYTMLSWNLLTGMCMFLHKAQCKC